ncbi:DUF6929 family protein, partial [Sphingobacterium sp. HJSM2_6]|uniref:DUF6929 family protein n=1 Tax=Sphingobacterium sp. HJSM2_6 TaxID=3366264 RepID=UPI003BC749F0
SDNSNYLYEYQISKAQLTKHPLLQRLQMEQIEKSEKMDLEAILYKDEKLFVFGSGSTPRRELGFSFSISDGLINTLDLSKLYQSMRKSANIDFADFNIEGVAIFGENWLFLNRGNGPGERNVIFNVRGINLIEDFQITSHDINIPHINGLSFGFSGATVIHNTLFFIATAEEGKSTYDDGKIGGTIFGIINLKTMKIYSVQNISQSHKFEGISLYEVQADKISFLLCEDNDGISNVASIFKLEITSPLCD